MKKQKRKVTIEHKNNISKRELKRIFRAYGDLSGRMIRAAMRKMPRQWAWSEEDQSAEAGDWFMAKAEQCGGCDEQNAHCYVGIFANAFGGVLSTKGDRVWAPVFRK
jgi:hypothetical protein